MKIFKKAISLVLVFAMLASFAGMTGYKYSPMSIVADATFKTGHGAVVRMPLTIYSRYYSSAGVISSYSSAAGDYLITSEANTAHGVNLEWYVAPPSGTTGFDVHMRINDTDDWTPLWSGSSGLSITDYPTITRDAGTAQNLDYGKLYGNCGVRGNGGFKDVDTIYVRLMLVSASGTTYDYWEVKVINEDKIVEVDMWDTIYKISGEYYTMPYPDDKNNNARVQSDTGDYSIPHFDTENNLSYKVVCPAGTTQFDVGCSIDRKNWTSYGTLTSTADPGYFTTGKAVMDRIADSAAFWDYGALYRNNLLGKGVGGFRDIGKIYWRAVYTCHGTEYIKYWSVDVVDWFEKDSQGVSKQWNGAASSSKPTDSHAGKNALTNIHVPATLYLNGTSVVVQSMDNRQGRSRRFDTYIMFTLPSGGYDPKVYQVNQNDEVVSGQLSFTKIGSSGSTHKWDVSSSTLPTNTTEVYYRIEYKVDVTDVTGNPDTITYTQYAASFVKPMENHNAVWFWAIGRGPNGDRKHKQTAFHEMGFLPFLVRNGADVEMSANMPTERNTGTLTAIDGSWNTLGWGKDGTFYGEYGLGYTYSAEGGSDNDTRYFWSIGVGMDDNAYSSNTIGATIYYDEQAKTVNEDNTYTLSDTKSSSVGMDVTFRDIEDGETAGHDKYKFGRFYGYQERWYKAANMPSYRGNDNDGGSAILLSTVVTDSSYEMVSNSYGFNLVTGVSNGQNKDPGLQYHYYYTFNKLSSVIDLKGVSHFYTRSRNNESGRINTAYGWHIFVKKADRSEPHTFINAAITQNYIKSEMDSTWWNTYRNSVFAAYVNCGNLTVAETTSFSTDLSNPVYKFADYSALNEQILKPAPWDRGGKVKLNSDGNFIDEDGNEVKTTEDKWYEKLQPEDNYIPWGASYGKWNSKTYATDYGKVTDEDIVYLAAYDLVFTEDTEAETMEFKVSNTPRTGAYYYTTATWNAYTAARDHAVGVYNYPNSTVATFDYNTAYPAKEATDNGNQANIGLACYCQSEIDAAASSLNTKRAALVKYDVNNNNYDINQYYRKLLSQLGSIAYDNSAKALFDFNTKHGFAGITSEIYDEASIVFRASAPEDVFDYVWKASEEYNEDGTKNPDYLGDGRVKVDADGNPLAIDDNGTPDDTSDDREVLASEVGDVGILEFPRADGTMDPVGRGNTFSQLYFDNSAKSQYAVTSARAALRNRLRWRMGGGGAAGYEYLGMVEGVYNQEGLTEDKLNNNPTQYFWSGKEHQDDILREVYALYRVKTTLRLAANYKQVVETLNIKNGWVPAYDVGGTTYKEKNLHTVTMFQGYNTPAGAWDTDSFDVTTGTVTTTYNTTGKTWYTKETWDGFVADRNKLAAMIYNGSTDTVGSESEINQEFSYSSNLNNSYYTYDVKLSSGLDIKNTYYTNGFYGAGGRLAAEYQDDINQAVKDYKAWFNGKTNDGKELVPKNLDIYKWTPTGEAANVIDPTDKVESIELKLDELCLKINAKHDVVVFTGSVNGQVVTAETKTEQSYSYSESDRTTINAAADAIKAEYAGSDDLGEKAKAFADDLSEINSDYDTIVEKGTIVYKDYWDAIVAHIAKLAAVAQITSENIQTAFLNKFTIPADVMTEVVGTEEQPELGAFYRAGVATTQEQVNAAVEQLFEALDQEFPSGEVKAAAVEAKAYPLKAEYQFKVYNYDFKGEAVNAENSIFSSDSITALNTAADAAIAKKYNVIKTAKATVNADKEAVDNLKNLKTDSPAGVLEHATVDMTYLNKAIAYAEGILYTTDDQENKVLAFETVTNFDGKTAKVNTYSDASVNELLTVLDEAAELDENMSYTKQLEVDKLTFAIYEETTDDTEYFITSDNQPVYREWPSGNMNWATARWEQNLYGIRDQKNYMAAPDYGLKFNDAYYDFLEIELSTPYTDKDGKRVDEVTPVWGTDGWLILNDDDTVPATSLIFGESWGTYKTRYEEALAIWNAYEDGTVYDISRQDEINTAAENLYKARIALEFKQNYFPNNQEDYEQACLWFKELEAYALKTPINRYGKVWVDVGVDADNDGVTDKDDKGNDITEPDLQDSDDPSDVAVENVYLYTGVDAALETLITQYQAKYASPTSTEPFDVKGAHETAYQQIKSEIETRGCTIKPANHADFKAGLNDLDANYIAGDWNGTTYTKNALVLSNEQSDVLQDMLEDVQGVMTGDATTLLGALISKETDDIHTYTLNTEAKDMEFASLMRGYLIEFMQLKYTSTSPAFYDGGATREFYIFDQSQVNQYIGLIDTFYNNPTYTNTALTNGYPTIYEVNNLVLAQHPSTKVISVTTYTNGVKGTQPPTTDVDKKIAEIFTKIGPKASYYTGVFENTNNYYTSPLEWIMNNAFVTGTNEEKLILADLDEAKSLSSKETVKDIQLGLDENQDEQTVEVNYDVNQKTNASYWYSEGYDYYNNSTVTDANDNNNREYYLYGASPDPIYGSSSGSWFTDEKVAALDAFINGTGTASGTNLNSYLYQVNKVEGINSLKSIMQIGKNSTDGNTLTALKSGGWKLQLNAQLQNLVKNAQKKLNDAAGTYYTNIRNLQLLPATLAYRQVEETYQAAMAKTVVTWSTAVDTGHFTVTSADSTAPLKKVIDGNEVTVARFYNTTEDFLKGLGEANYKIIDSGYYSPSLPGQYDKTSTKWTALETFYSTFKNTSKANMITIDKAALVTAVDMNDIGNAVKDTDSPMQKLIKYLYALELVAYDFTELNEFVSAFLGNPDGDKDTALNNLATKYYETYNFTGTYYNAKFYTEDSLKAVYDLLLNNGNGLGVIKQTVYNAAKDAGTPYVIDTTFVQDTHGGAFYDEPIYNGNAIGNPSIAAYTQAIADKIKALVLRPANTATNIDSKTGLDSKILEAIDIIDNQTEIYVRDDDKWNAFIKKLYAGTDGTGTRENPASGTAMYVQGMCDINVNGYYTAAEHQETVNTVTNELISAIEDLNKNADKTAPKMTVLTGKDELDAFYASQTKVSADAKFTNADYLSEAENGTTPAAATLLMANNGYSLLVYTNQLNPRIVITLQDIADVIDAAKGESIEISAVRTSGVNAYLIYGSMNENGAITEINPKVSVTAGSGFKGYTNKADTDGSSVFAILAPTFDGSSAKSTQQARYTIKAYDQAGLTNALNAQNNYVNKLHLGGNDADGTEVTVGTEKEITIHIHYHNSMSSVNDEGITLDANSKPVETTPDAKEVNRVPGVYFDGELTYDGYWRAGVVLQRRFSSMVRNWEFVSEVKNGQISGCAVSGYNDPNFGVLNTGSFYYVLDRTADADVYNKYFDEKKTEKGIIDYTAATAAKQMMLENMDDDKLTAMRESKKMFDYGQDKLWSQALNNKIEDGDLVFVHVVDRWGNVVNRIIEVPNFDNVVPNAVSPAAGIVNIEENGGAGIANINIWNGLKFEEMVAADYEVVDSQTQKLTLKDGATATVSCSGNVLTITGLTPGGGYSIDVYDKAGNIKIVGTRASSADENGKGSIQIKITDIANGIFDDTVSGGEEGSVMQQSAMFTLNGTDTVILNTGMESSIINADIKGNVLANQTVMHTITTKDTVTQLKSVSADGQTEEWTKTTSYVKDNDDGTLTWIIPRKFTEGEHTYKVYAMVDGKYETYSAPCSITATTKTVVLTVKNAGPGRTIIVYSGAIEQKNSTFKSYVIPYGAEVRITAETTKEGSEFYYWFSNFNNRILSTADEYSFTAVSNVNCSAQFTSDEMLRNNKKLVVYVNNAKNVIKAFNLADGEAYTVPAGPILPDYTFKGWNMTPAEVYASDKDVVVVEPVYELNASSTVTILEGNYTTTGAGTYASENNKRPTVTISASKFDNDGAEFLYWFDVDTNEMVSFNRTYSFHCVKDTVLVPVYGDASTITPAPIVRLTAVKYSALNGKVSFFAERSVPEEFIVHKTGIVFTKTESIGTNEEVFVLGGTATTPGESTNTANNGYYSANVEIATGQTVWARAYAVCEDESGEIFEVYGPIASYTLK